MKIAIITDQHFGARNDSLIFHKHFEKFYSEVFFPYILENDIKRIIDMGDTFEKRETINFHSLKLCKKYWFDEIKNNDLRLTMLVGNHCSYFKNTITTNSPRLLLQEYSNNITLIDSPKELHYDGMDVVLVPWICKDNQEESLNLISSSLAPVCMGHFDIQGFEMFKNSITSTKGLSQKLFERFELVLSGHFHTRSKQGNILYTGTPIEHCWSDYNDPKGFHILDSKTLEFVKNPFVIHEKHVFKAGEKPPTDVSGKYLKLFIEGSYDPLELDMWISKIEEQGPAELKKIETNLAISDIMDDSTQIENVENYSILDIANENIKDEEAIKIFHDLYREALAINVNI